MQVDYFSLFPHEILTEILLRLPIESLVRFSSVCKSWHDLILNENYFSRLHLDQWRSRFGILYNTSTYCVNEVLFYLSFDYKVDGAKHLVWLEDCFSKIRYFTDDKGDEAADCPADFWVVDSCDGLLLIELDSHSFSDRKRRLLLCNPLMKSFKLLPNLHGSMNIIVENCHWSIAYDVSIKRYKIFGITREIITKDGKESRILYIFELMQQGWKELCVSLGALDFGGKVETSLVEKGKLYYLTKHSSDNRMSFKTNLLYIDIATYEVEATASSSVRCWTCATDFWLGWNGRFYFSNPYQGCDSGFDLSVLNS